MNQNKFTFEQKEIKKIMSYLEIISKNSWKTLKCVKGIFVKVEKINKKLLIFMMPKLIESPLLGKIMVNLLVFGKFFYIFYWISIF